jgi:oligopeptide transport system substrate-binding protein
MTKSKMSRAVALLCTVAVVGTLFSGCSTKSNTAAGAKAATPQIINLNLGAEPKTIDPALNDAVDGATVICNAFEGLERLDSKDQPIPGVAEKYEVSTDGLHYTFHLRSNAVWSDGKPVTAQDFEYAWKRALDPATASNYAYQMYYIKNGQGFNESALAAKDKTAGITPATKDQVGVKAIDAKTLQVDLAYPTAYFLSLMAFPTYAPVRQDIVEKNPTDWATKPETYVVNGPFKLKEWKSKDTITFVKNDKYWNASTVKLAQINYKVLDQASSYLAAFKTGQLDYIESPPTQETPQLIKDGTAKIYPYLGTYYIDVNIDPKAAAVDPKAAKALSDPNVRKALAMGLDRQSLIDNVTKGGQLPATSFVPNGIPEDKTGKDFKQKDFYAKDGSDVAKAQKLLADAGYPGGKGFPTITYMYNTDQGHQNIAQAVQDMWQKNLGITVVLKNQEWKVFQVTRTSKQYVVARGGWIADYTDPMTFLDLLTSSSGNNEPGYKSPAYDAKVLAAKVEIDPAKRMQDMHDAEDILMNDMPLIPLYFYTNVCCIKNYVKVIHKSPLGFVFLDTTYIQK